MFVRGNDGVNAIMFEGTNDPDYLLDAQATSSSATTVVSKSSLLNDMDPMIGRLVVTPGGTTADVAAGDVVVVGADLEGNAQSESFTFTENQSTAEVGALTFGDVTSITFHQQDGAAATFDVGLLPILDIVLSLERVQLLETWVTFESAVTEVESFVAAIEYAASSIHDVQLSSDTVNTLTFLRKADLNIQGLAGFQYHWTWTDTDDLDWGFVARIT